MIFGNINNLTNGPIGFAALQLSAISGFNNFHIDIVNNTIKNSAGTPIYTGADGGTHIQINISRNNVINEWDPNNKNGFALTTTNATAASPTLSFNNNPGVAVGMAAWYFNGTTSAQIGTVVSAGASTVTLNQNVAVPSGGTVIFSGVGLFGATIATTASAANARYIADVHHGYRGHI